MSNLEKKAFLEILGRYHKGAATPEEEAFLNAYFNIFELDQDFFDGLTLAQQEEISTRLKGKIDERISEKKAFSSFKTITWRWIGVAATVAVVAFAGFYLNSRKESLKTEVAVGRQANTDILPGGNKAVLILADGSRVSLTDVANGKVLNADGIKITKTGDGKIVYDIAINDHAELANSFNTIQTPRGGEYSVNLPDGTRVMLNAESSLKFPVSFTNKPQRVVELTGEAYFEVAHNNAQPFKVISAKQEVQVLGTDFNINAYTDEPAIVTTLVVGSVSVSHGNIIKVIKPLQAAVVKSGIDVRPANECDIAWKSGIISFKNADIETIMRQVARWYDVEISIAGKIPSRLFTGEISRKSNLSEVIAIFESSNIKFRFNKRHITLIP